MEKPVFLVLRKYFHGLCGYDVPFTTCDNDVDVYASFAEAKDAAIRWARDMGREVNVFLDTGEVSRAACQYDAVVFSLCVTECFSSHFWTCGASIYQKYVI